MILIPSTPDPDGHVVVAEFDQDTQVVAVFSDGSDPVDLTKRLADLVLLGMHANARRTQGIDGAPQPSQTVEVASITCEGTPPQFVYAHPASGQAVRFGWPEADDLVSIAVAEMITAGVASDVAAAELGGIDDPGALDDTPAPWAVDDASMPAGDDEEGGAPPQDALDEADEA